MAQFKNMYPVDLQTGPAVVALNEMFKGDADANRIGAIVTDGGETVALGGGCAGTVILANGATVAVEGVVSGNEAYIVLDDDAYTVPGPIIVAVTWVSGDKKTTMVYGVGNVSGMGGGSIQPGQVTQDVADLIAAIDEAVASIPSDYSALSTAVAALQSNAFYAREVPADVYDLNAFTDTGMYALYASREYSHLPAEILQSISGAKMLLVYEDTVYNSYTVQSLYILSGVYAGNVYIRRLASSTWTDWIGLNTKLETKQATDEAATMGFAGNVSRFTDFIQGTGNDTTGAVIPGSGYKLITRDIQDFDYPIRISIPAGYKTKSWIMFYSANGTYTEWKYFAPSGGYDYSGYDFPAHTKIRLILGKDDNSEIPLSDANLVTFRSREGLVDSILKYRVKLTGTGADENFLGQDRVFDLVQGTIGTSGITYSDYWLTTQNTIHVTEDIVLYASDDYAYYSWIAFYASESTAAQSYSSWSYFREPVFVPAGSYVRVTLNKRRNGESANQNAITLEDVLDCLYIRRIETQKYLKICSFNVGVWHTGASTGDDARVPDNLVESYRTRWYKLLGEADPDIICMQEYGTYFDHGNNEDPYTYIFQHKYPYYYKNRTKVIVSKYPLFGFAETIFSTDTSSQNPRSYISGTVMVNGKRITLINTHLSTESNSTGDRQTQISELITFMGTAPGTVILCGDFNTYRIDEFDAFSRAGYELSNHGIFGDFATWPHVYAPDPTWNQCIDNVITSGQIQMVTEGDPADAVLPSEASGAQPLSDHTPLYAVIRL